MKALDTKLLRDLARLWAQSLAIALVIACGVATLVLAIGAYRSLGDTRDAYYQRYRFASVFASATRAPQALEREIAATDGVAAVETRIVEPALLDIAGLSEPAAASVVSIPGDSQPRLNRLYLRSGRLPDPDRIGEVAVSAEFADAHGFTVGSRFTGTLRGHQVEFRITGLALSPEYIYVIGPGELVPDHRRFAIIWMPHKQLEGLADLDNVFNQVSVLLLPGTSEKAVIARLDHLLMRYGGTGAYGRVDQTSHAFLDNEMTQLKAMARIIPPIFLVVSAFLVNMVLSRLITLEREQIGLLKALGYARRTIAWHYVKFIAAIAGTGVVIGFIAGTWLGQGLARLYSEFFNFPFLIFHRGADIYVLAAAISVTAAMAGGIRAVYAAATLPPAVAMRPAAPPLYRRAGLIGRSLARMVSQLTVMAVRHMVRQPLRAAYSMLGSGLAVALLVTALATFGSVDAMIDILFFRTSREDATATFTIDKGRDAMIAAARLPGVFRAEPFRVMNVDIAHGSLSRRMTLTGKPHDMHLSRLLDIDDQAVALPPGGIVLSEWVAGRLAARIGDIVQVTLLDEGWRQIELPVTGIIRSYVGLGAYMDLAALDRLSRFGPRRSGAYLAFDNAKASALYEAVKGAPAIAGLAVKRISLDKFRATMEQNILIMTLVYLGLAVIIAFGVVYNAARIQLSERARELASLRVLGFHHREVMSVLVIELAVLTLIAQPLGWLLGYGFTWAVVRGFQSDLFRVPFVVEPSAYGQASLVVLTASLASALVVIRRVRHLDLIRVLKTRE